MFKHYSFLIVAVFMSVVMLFYYYYSESVLAESYIDENMFGVLEFDGSHGGREEILSENNGKDELKSRKCGDLNKIASDMLYDSEIIALPYETNHTRWRFHKRSNLNYLKSLYDKWSGKSIFNGYSTAWIKYVNSTQAKDIKAKKYFVTFGCNCCAKATVNATKAAKFPGGFDFTLIHDLNSLSQTFRDAFSGILWQKQGCGYWLWKPYIILKTFIENMSDNDIVMYQDAGAYLIKNAGPLLKLAQESKSGIIVFHTDSQERFLTKRDAFILMEMDDERVYNSYQRLASFIVLRKTCHSLQFVMEWLAYASDPRILTNIENKLGKNLPEFRDNRHDQTVLSLLSKRWQLDEYRDPSQHGNTNEKSMYAYGPYSQLISHTRDKS